jgi:hypothetical protein
MLESLGFSVSLAPYSASAFLVIDIEFPFTYFAGFSESDFDYPT